MVIKIEKINDKELEKINGGGTAGIWIGLGVAAALVFISGVIEGISNPKNCNE